MKNKGTKIEVLFTLLILNSGLCHPVYLCVEGEGSEVQLEGGVAKNRKSDQSMLSPTGVCSRGLVVMAGERDGGSGEDRRLHTAQAGKTS